MDAVLTSFARAAAALPRDADAARSALAAARARWGDVGPEARDALGAAGRLLAARLDAGIDRDGAALAEVLDGFARAAAGGEGGAGGLAAARQAWPHLDAAARDALAPLGSLLAA